MDCILIKCPHCGANYLTIVKDSKEKCPSCEKEVTIKIIPGTIEISKG